MNIFGRLLFSYVTPLVRLARTKDIEESDFPVLPEFLKSESSDFPTQKIRWQASPMRFLFSLIEMASRFTRPAYILYFWGSLISLASPVLVHRFVGLISKGITDQNLNEALIYALLLGLAGILPGLLMQYYFFNSLKAYQVLTNVMNEKIYTHSLRLSQSARQKNQVGDIVNHMSSDSDSIADVTSIMGDLFSSIMLILGVTAMLFYYIGWSAFSALAVLCTLAPLTSYVSKKFFKLDTEMMQHRDHRVTVMTQVLNAIRVVKYFAWEKSVYKEVTEIRAKELEARRRLARAEVISGLGYLGVSSVVLFVALATHAYRGQTLDAALIFTCISLFGLLEGPFGSMSRTISRVTAAKVGSERVLKFLKQEEIPHEDQEDASGEIARGLQFKSVNLQYEGAGSPILANLNLQVPAGASLAIVGPVGAGKSTILSAILGEMVPVQGAIEFVGVGLGVRPRMAYVPQEAYIINSSLLENLQFGENVTKEELRRAVHNACLQRDLKEWSGGLRTEIGEKGVNLSGGQKQRVALARAFLRKPQIVLLDDPLSAVDSETENLLCERLLFGAWKDTTRVVVTHRLEHLRQFDQILFVEAGVAKGYGRLEDLLKTCDPFAAFYEEHRKTQGDHPQAVATPEVVPTHDGAEEFDTKKNRVTEDEDREVGAVKGSLYWDYVSSLGGDGKFTRPLFLSLLALGSLSAIALPLLQKAWLSHYSSHQSEWAALTAVGIYGILGIVVLLGHVSNHLFWLSRGIAAGRNIHDKMLKSVLHSPVRFFDSTPVGRVLQRFSRDVESVDVHLQWAFDEAVFCFLQVAVALVLILALMPAMIVVVVPVMWFYYIMQRDYRRPAREAKRFDSVARSPRYAHFKETLQGLTVIRGFNKSEWFLQNFHQKLAHSQRMFYGHYLLNRWFSSRIPVVGGVISTATAISIVLSAKAGMIDAGTAGLVTIYSLSFWGFLNWGVRIFADMESRMTSIERLKFFSNLPSEVSVLKPSHQELPPQWPAQGKIEVSGLQVRYAAHLPLVLKGLTFKVEPGTRVGIIGRTGSGKSTFFQTLFRFIEAEQGSIFIDGVDIASVPLERLRRSLAIIPQDPTLFMGTIRNNLDRYLEYTDEQVMAALKKASMWDFVSMLPNGINAEVSEGGLNLSQGQRQLLCLARALLTNARVIVMDEATASVDVKTDSLLQEVIRTSLQGVTMLIIAHRLGTVADCDQIVEISAGEIKSIRSPKEISVAEIEESLV